MMDGMALVTVRFHVDPHMEAAPVAVQQIESPLPPTLILPDDELGLASEYRLRRRFQPDRISGAEATADYVWSGIA